MIGFELNIKGEKISAALPKGNVHIIADILNKEIEEIRVVFAGLNSENYEQLYWYENSLKIGDEFTVKVVDISHSSKPTRIEKKEDVDLFITEGKLKTYNFLKKELEEKGLI